MSWVGRRKSALVLAAAIAAFAASACLPAPPPPPPPPPPEPCQSAGAASPEAGKDEPARPPSDQPIPPDEAGAQAREVSSTTEVRTKDGEIPLVTVEEPGGRPEITSTPVSSPDEAAAVAEQKAADGDLVAVDVDRPVRALGAPPGPNDELFGQQWAFGRVPYVQAWATDGTTGEGVTVAVVDTGVTANHPDLSGQVLNGHFFLHSNDGQTAFEGAGGTTDPNGHGTHVGGSITATSNNTIGISGAAPGTQVLPVQVLCADGTGFASDVASGIIWAVDNGAEVINLSLGGGQSSAELSAIQHADANDVAVVAAGGNDGQSGNPPSYPAAYSPQQPNLIAVAATDVNDVRASYSTIENYLDLAAPGGVPVSGCAQNAAQEILSTWNNGGYCSIAGTSMATAHVSGAAALLVAAASCADDQVKTRLKATAVPLGPANQYGAGLLDPNAAGAICV